MPNLFSFFSLPPLGAMIGMLSFWATGTFLVIYDLLRMYREPRKEPRLAWYERPLLWLGGTGIAIGLVALADRVIATLPDDWPVIIFFLGFFAIQILFALCLIIAIAKSGNQREKQPRPAHAAQYAFSTHTLIRESPLFKNTQILLIAWVYMDGMAIWWICGSFLHLADNTSVLDYMFLLFGPFAIWGLHRTFAQLRQFKHIERLRIEFAERTRPEVAAFAPAFPFQGPPQLLAPALLLRQTWRAMPGWFVWGLTIGAPITQSFVPSSVPVMIFKLFIALLIAGLLCSFRLSFRCKIEATQYYLTAGCGFQSKSIAWQDARLFACYQVPSFFFEYKAMMIYELSGPGQVVQWTRVIDARSPFAFWRPVLPIDKYQQQMQALCDLITTKTGLQLHKLSEEKLMELRASLAQ